MGHVCCFSSIPPDFRVLDIVNPIIRDVADMIPSATVRGIDVSPIQPAWIPPNLKFEIDDYNKDWLDASRYDLVHSREILGTVPDWVAFYKKALR